METKNLKQEIRAEDIMPAAEKVEKILRTITRIEADDDWDGIAAALIAKAEIRRLTGRVVPINVSDAKVVPSDATTLVVDKTTDGEGWVVDHHKGSVVPKNYLAFCNDGTIPSSSLMYRIIPDEGKSSTLLLLGATGEIMDGLFERGEKDGCAKEALKVPSMSLASRQKNQFLRGEELYSIADMLALLPTLDSKRALEVGERIDAAKTASVEDVLALCDEGQREFVGRYLRFMKDFPYDKFCGAKIGAYAATIAQEKQLEFPMPALARILRERPGNYVIFKEKGLSIRTQDGEFFEQIKAKIGDNWAGGGGRAGWYGAQFKTPMSYEKFCEVMGLPTKVRN